VTRDTPTCDKRFRTVLYLATENGGTTEATCVTNTWQSFSKGTEPQDVCAWNVTSGTYNRPLHYYKTSTATADTAAALLANGDGQCRAWAELFKECLLVNKVTNVKETVVQRPADYSSIAVKNVHYSGVTYDAPFKYAGTDLVFQPPPDAAKGAPGQNVDTPKLKGFQQHIIVHREDDTVWYDPSYGISATGPGDYTDKAIGAWERDSDNHWANADDVAVNVILTDYDW